MYWLRDLFAVRATVTDKDSTPFRRCVLGPVVCGLDEGEPVGRSTEDGRTNPRQGPQGVPTGYEEGPEDWYRNQSRDKGMGTGVTPD